MDGLSSWETAASEPGTALPTGVGAGQDEGSTFSVRGGWAAVVG